MKQYGEVSGGAPVGAVAAADFGHEGVKNSTGRGTPGRDLSPYLGGQLLLGRFALSPHRGPDHEYATKRESQQGPRNRDHRARRERLSLGKHRRVENID